MHSPYPVDKDPRFRALGKMTRTFKTIGAVGKTEYYDALFVLSDFELRQLWIAEGKRRGYELS